MKLLLRNLGAVLLAAAIVFLGAATSKPAMAGTVGTISGTLTDAGSGAPIANAAVTAAAPTGTRSTTTDSRGFFVINALSPDTFVVSFQAAGYATATQVGVTVQQDQTTVVNQKLTKTLRTIAAVTSRAAGNLVRPGQGSDVYNISGTQLTAATGADNRPQTLYEYLGTVPGVTINGGTGTPRIRGGDVHDIGYEFDGIPLRERLFGIFTSNITNVGIGNIEVYTGGLPSSDSANGTGIINSVVRSGTYPAAGHVSYVTTFPDHNQYPNIDYGGMTANRKFSYYMAFGGVNSSNDYNGGANTYPDLLFGGSDGAGPVKERDIVGNFHFKPNAKNDIQVLAQNGIGDFIFNYLEANPQQKLSWQPCPGYMVDPTGNSYTGAIGGTAPNGQTCPVGVYFGGESNNGNIWHHYSGLGKVQWNHIINDHSYFALRVAENYNQYIFAQPLEDPNNPSLENPGGAYNVNPACPLYPYSAGTPVQIYGGNTGNICSQDIQSFYGDRSSHMYLGALDYTNVVGPKLTFNFGLGQEYDNNLLAYDLKDYISGNGTFPDVYAYSDIPTHLPYVYTNLTAKVGKFSLTPGLRYQREYYGIPASAGGSRFVSALIPSFNGTYQAGPNDIFRFSYGVSEDFIGSAYVYRSYPRAAGGAIPNPSYNPSTNGSSFNPEQNHSADLMWEHQFGPDTSMRFGPFMNSANNYYEQYNFLKGYTPTGEPIYSKQTYFTNSGKHHAFGLELAVNHVDHHSTGVSWWLSATLDNYWTSSPGAVTAVSPLIRPFPTYFAENGIQFRSSDNPLFAANFYADIHSGRFDLYPKFYYQVGTFYNIGTFQPKSGPPQIIPEAKALGYFTGQVSETYKLDPAGSTIIGVAVRNLFDMEHGTTPCFNSGSGTGCYPFDGPQSGFRATPSSYVYQNVTTDPRRFEFFITKKLP